jgi:hypothetical protein
MHFPCIQLFSDCINGELYCFAVKVSMTVMSLDLFRVSRGGPCSRTLLGPPLSTFEHVLELLASFSKSGEGETKRSATSVLDRFFRLERCASCRGRCDVNADLCPCVHGNLISPRDIQRQKSPSLHHEPAPHDSQCHHYSLTGQTSILGTRPATANVPMLLANRLHTQLLIYE